MTHTPELDFKICSAPCSIPARVVEAFRHRVSRDASCRRKSSAVGFFFVVSWLRNLQYPFSVCNLSSSAFQSDKGNFPISIHHWNSGPRELPSLPTLAHTLTPILTPTKHHPSSPTNFSTPFPTAAAMTPQPLSTLWKNPTFANLLRTLPTVLTSPLFLLFGLLELALACLKWTLFVLIIASTFLLGLALLMMSVLVLVGLLMGSVKEEGAAEVCCLRLSCPLMDEG